MTAIRHTCKHILSTSRSNTKMCWEDVKIFWWPWTSEFEWQCKLWRGSLKAPQPAQQSHVFQFGRLRTNSTIWLGFICFKPKTPEKNGFNDSTDWRWVPDADHDVIWDFFWRIFKRYDAHNILCHIPICQPQLSHWGLHFEPPAGWSPPGWGRELHVWFQPVRCLRDHGWTDVIKFIWGSCRVAAAIYLIHPINSCNCDDLNLRWPFTCWQGVL